MNHAEFGITGQHHISLQPLVIGVASQESGEVFVASEGMRCKPDIQAVVDAAVRVGRIVAAVLDQIDAEQPDLRRLRIERNEERVDFERTLIYLIVGPGISKQDFSSLAQALRNL